MPTGWPPRSPRHPWPLRQRHRTLSASRTWGSFFYAPGLDHIGGDRLPIGGLRQCRLLAAVGHSEMSLRAHWVPSRGSNRTEDGPPPLSKCPTKAQCRFGLRSGSFSCHWDKPLVSSHPADSEILSSSLWLRAVVGVSLRARHNLKSQRSPSFCLEVA